MAKRSNTKMIYFLIPVFNESKNILPLKNDLVQCLPGHDKFFVFVDDCSTDNTVSVIHENFFDINYRLIEKKQNKGPGDSFNRGFEWILNNRQENSEYIVTLEGDNTSDLSILPKMVAISDLGFDLVLASVYSQGGKLDQTTFFRKLLSFFANLIMRLTLNLNVLTLSSFYRVYKINLVEKIKANHRTIISENGFLSKVEILIKAIQLNASVIEVPTTLLSKRRKGKSKMKISKTLIDYLKLIFKSRKFFKNN
ncbi:MAG: glycosyltransferase [Bacteroidales bacterium]|jgi:dolichol-phosphate mannosyltransferase|nr:glycosyltransferase [Bacteroidales bacterium]